MALSLPRPFKPAAIVIAAAYTTLTFGAAITPSPAQAASVPFYHAELSAPVAKSKARPIASGTVWKCAENACTAGEASSRPAIVCARLAKEVGPLTSFTAGGKTLEADDLARCNGK